MKSDYVIRKMVQARLEKSLQKKMKEENRIVRSQQKELKEFVLTRKDKPTVEKVQPDEIVNLSNNYDSPYMSIKGAQLWGGLKRSWQGYKIGKRLGEDEGDVFEKERQKECAVKVQELQKLLRTDVDEFKCLEG